MLPREKGSNAHDPLDPMCVEWVVETADGAVCPVCSARESARTTARAAMAREIGS